MVHVSGSRQSARFINVGELLISGGSPDHAARLGSTAPSSAHTTTSTHSNNHQRWIGAGLGGSGASDWAHAVERTKRREESVRAKQEQTMLEARRQAELEEEAHRAADAEALRQAEARQQRMQKLIRAKEEKLRQEAERARKLKEVEEVNFSSAVALKKLQEREVRAMAAEEERTRKVMTTLDQVAKTLEQQRLQELMADADLRRAEKAETERLAAEDFASELMRQEEREQSERARMQLADNESRAATLAAAAAEWEERVRKSKEALRIERNNAEREAHAMTAEDSAASIARDVDRAIQLATEGQAAMARAAAKAAEEEQQRVAAAVHAAMQAQAAYELERLFIEGDQMELEDQRSSDFRRYNLQMEWQEAVASRKHVERSLRGDEAKEQERMHLEDEWAQRLRQKESTIELERLEAERLIRLQAARIAAETEREEDERKRLCKKAFEAYQAQQREQARSRVRAEWQLMRLEDERGSRRQEQMRERDRETIESAGMAAEDVVASAARREERRTKQVRLEMDQEYISLKAENRRQAAEQLQRRKQQELIVKARAAEAEKSARRANDEAEQRRLRTRQEEERAAMQQRADAATAANKLKLTENRRRAEILEEERRMFDALYRENRNLVKSHRCREAGTADCANWPCTAADNDSLPPQQNSVQLPQAGLVPPRIGGCADEMLAYAHSVSRCGLAAGAESADTLDESMTFFTES